MSAKAATNARKLLDRLLPQPDYGSLLGILATTYELDARFVEVDLLPTIFGLGAWDDRNWASRVALERELASLEACTVLGDARGYHHRPQSLRIEVLPAIGPGGTLLHAKVLLLVHEDAVRLLVGSANLTQAGFRANREVVLPLVAEKQSPVATGLVVQAVREMESRLTGFWTADAGRVLALARAKLQRWEVTESPDDRFLWSGDGSPLWRRVVAAWPEGESIERISIVSPFWSEEKGQGPLGQFCGALGQRGGFVSGAELHLHGEAGPAGSDSEVPRLPRSFQTLDRTALGMRVFAHAVDPSVAKEESGNVEVLTRRALHAKVVLVEGRETSLAYLGSANFTRQGWGFPGARGNIEAGVLLRRRGRERQLLASLIPESTGSAVELGGGEVRLLGAEEGEGEAAWPTFLRSVRFSQDDLGASLLLELDAAALRGSFTVGLPSGAVLLAGGPTSPAAPRVPLVPKLRAELLDVKEVEVRWWASAEPRKVPVNTDPASRERLPLAPDSGAPGEDLLLAYYQGRIRWEDLHPRPPDWEEDADDPAGRVEESAVDTSRIRAYQMREFVEALPGIKGDLERAREGTPASMRLALLGPVSPVALGRAAYEAVERGRRSPVAGGFQLLEILACLADVAPPEDERSRDSWIGAAKLARDQLEGLLDRLREAHRGDLTGTFARYEKGVRQATGLGRNA